MVLIFGLNFTEARSVARVLQSFYGIGPKIAERVMARLHIHSTARIGDLRPQQVDGLTNQLTAMPLENELRRQLQENIRRLRDMGTYRGRRHAMGLPVRGQNTRSQIKTARKLNRVERRF